MTKLLITYTIEGAFESYAKVATKLTMYGALQVEGSPTQLLVYVSHCVRKFSIHHGQPHYGYMKGFMDLLDDIAQHLDKATHASLSALFLTTRSTDCELNNFGRGVIRPSRALESTSMQQACLQYVCDERPILIAYHRLANTWRASEDEINRCFAGHPYALKSGVADHS